MFWFRLAPQGGAFFPGICLFVCNRSAEFADEGFALFLWKKARRDSGGVGAMSAPVLRFMRCVQVRADLGSPPLGYWRAFVRGDGPRPA